MNSSPIDVVSGSVFKLSAFRNLFLARLLTVLGNGIAPIALAFAVLDFGGSAVDLGIVVAVRSLFNVIFLLLGGVLADRYSRSAVLFISSLVAALSQAAIAWLVLESAATVMSLSLLGAVNGAAAGVALPASSALVPQTVPKHKLREANAFIQSGVYGGSILGASLGGFLTSAVGPGWGLVIDALGFAVAAPLYAMIRTVGAQQLAAASNIIHDLREGWHEFVTRSWVWVVVVQFAIVNAAFSGVMMILGPVVADETFGRAQWGVIVAAQSLGLMVGSFAALRWRPKRDLWLGVISVVFCALPMALLGVSASPYWLMMAFFIAGVCFGVFGVVWSHALQTHIPPHKLARVYAYDALGSFVTIPLGELAAGPLALKFGHQQVLVVSAAAVVIATLLASWTPSIRRFDSHSTTQHPHSSVAHDAEKIELG